MRRLWVAFVMVSVMGFGILGWVGSRIYQETPPIPERVLTADGSVVVPDGDIGRGQNVWQTMGGMEVGSVWGHGSYVAPDWTADWLHRKAVFILNDWARAEAGRSYLEPCSGRLARGRTAAVSHALHTAPQHGSHLIVTSGVGWTQEWGGPIVELRAGDVVWCPPSIKHWHGATPTAAMTHIALTGTVGGKNVEWMEKVSDEQYRR